jgi:DNA repair exonuclease SbcCD nuclease subunit
MILKMKNKIILVGDVHGEWDTLKYNIKRYGYENAYIIQVGDFGVGFRHESEEKRNLFGLNKVLEENSCHLFAIRGNHDDPSRFKERNHPYDYENITLLPDYSELELLGKNILLIGGAVSIDRLFRVEGKSYWSNETFELKLEHEFPYKGQYDLVVTHTRPGVCGAFKGFDNIKYWCDQDSDLIDDLIEESHKLNNLYDLTKPKWWVGGHFHQSLTLSFESTTYRCLDIHEHYLYHQEDSECK